MRAERIFKMTLLDWLNNGETKLFRSPSEGNYLVKLTNVSLSPEDKLGRMLHNFSCQAYEIEDLSYSNLLKLGFIQNVSEEKLIIKGKTLRFTTNEEQAIDPIIYISDTGNGFVKLNDEEIYETFSLGVPQNSSAGGWLFVRLGKSEKNKILVNTKQGFTLKYPKSKIPDLYYYYEDNSILVKENSFDGLMSDVILSYTYKTTSTSIGNIYEGGRVIDRVYLQTSVRSFYGGPETTTSFEFKDTISSVEKREFIKFLTVYFHKKTPVELFHQSDKYYLKDNPSIEVSSFEEKNLYKIYDAGAGEVYYPAIYINNSLENLVSIGVDYSVGLYNNGELVAGFEEIPFISLTDIEFDEIKVGNGIYFECSYQEKITTYKGENT